MLSTKYFRLVSSGCCVVSPNTIRRVSSVDKTPSLQLQGTTESLRQVIAMHKMLLLSRQPIGGPTAPCVEQYAWETFCDVSRLNPDNMDLETVVGLASMMQYFSQFWANQFDGPAVGTDGRPAHPLASKVRVEIETEVSRRCSSTCKETSTSSSLKFAGRTALSEGGFPPRRSPLDDTLE
mmetsp:Transcript_60488/g.70107  ORF Transcript_60488/g.70107 Transcript_60488/m.70107 type:complete len:180 (+) Transcript_60488:19-558(+)